MRDSDNAAAEHGLFGHDPRTRIVAARSLAGPQRARRIEALNFDSPYKPWPRGMPTSINPLVLVIGVSPGNSPPSSGPAFLPDYTPSFGVPAPGLTFPDSSHFWDKVRLLSTEFVRAWDSSLTPVEALALVGSLNLGTGMFGKASHEAVEPAVVRWVSSVVSRMHARVVIGLGLKGLLTGPKGAGIREAWNQGGLPVNWLAGELVLRDIFKFTHFRAGTERERVDIILWPQHPSQAPFGGRGGPGSRWEESALVGAKWMRETLPDQAAPS